MPGLSVGGAGAGAVIPPPAAPAAPVAPAPPAAPAAPAAPATPEVGSIVTAAGEQLSGAALTNALSSLNNGVTDFNGFMDMFGKTYDTPQEQVFREAMFVENMQIIDVTRDTPRISSDFDFLDSQHSVPGRGGDILPQNKLIC